MIDWNSCLICRSLSRIRLICDTVDYFRFSEIMISEYAVV